MRCSLARIPPSSPPPSSIPLGSCYDLRLLALLVASVVSVAKAARDSSHQCMRTYVCTVCVVFFVGLSKKARARDIAIYSGVYTVHIIVLSLADFVSYIFRRFSFFVFFEFHALLLLACDTAG